VSLLSVKITYLPRISKQQSRGASIPISKEPIYTKHETPTVAHSDLFCPVPEINKTSNVFNFDISQLKV
jgi:hypothetical protein